MTALEAKIRDGGAVVSGDTETLTAEPGLGHHPPTVGPGQPCECSA